jgi:hypothetical protein
LYVWEGWFFEAKYSVVLIFVTDLTFTRSKHGLKNWKKELVTPCFQWELPKLLVNNPGNSYRSFGRAEIGNLNFHHLIYCPFFQNTTSSISLSNFVSTIQLFWTWISDSYVKILKFSQHFSHVFNKLLSDKSPLCSRCKARM